MKKEVWSEKQGSFEIMVFVVTVGLIVSGFFGGCFLAQVKASQDDSQDEETGLNENGSSDLQKNPQIQQDESALRLVRKKRILVAAIEKKNGNMGETIRTKKKRKSAQDSSDETTKLSTDMQFSDHAVDGKYQIPLESLSVVEDEKKLEDLIGVRKNFNDRIEKYKRF